MKFVKLILLAFIVSGFSLAIAAQTTNKKVSAQSQLANNQAAKSSLAYAEILLQKTELEAQLEDFLISYTDDFPKIKEIRFRLGLMQKETDRLLAVNPADASKLSLALGRLIVRKTELETELWNLKNQYNDDFPEVRKTKRKIEIFEKAISEILS